jgi:hypothetical protein
MEPLRENNIPPSPNIKNGTTEWPVTLHTKQTSHLNNTAYEYEAQHLSRVISPFVLILQFSKNYI